MIDTDKYEGHTLGPWEQYSVAAYHAVVIPMERGGCLDDGKATELVPHTLEDAKLIADAPLLLAEVKRLRVGEKLLNELYEFFHGTDMHFIVEQIKLTYNGEIDLDKFYEDCQQYWRDIND